MVRYKPFIAITLTILTSLIILICFLLAHREFPIDPPIMGKNLVPYHNMRNNFRVVPQHHLATCQIEKVASTVLTSIFCYLYDTENFVKANRSIRTEGWSNRFCVARNEVFTLHELTARMGSDYTMMVLVRDPMERFISGFIDKCVNEYHNCLGCYQDLKCLVDRIYGDLNYYVENHVKIEYNYIYAHFAPQTWYCSLDFIMNKVKFVKYASHGAAKLKMIDDIVAVMGARKVPEYKTEHISSVMRNSTTSHATRASKFSQIIRQLIMEDEYLQSMIHKIYHHDFKLYKLLDRTP